jgi:hypothetical protein
VKLKEFIALYRLQNPSEAHKSQSEILKNILDRAATTLPARVEKGNGLHKVKSGAFNPHILNEELRRSDIGKD